MICHVHDLGLMEYQQAWDLQNRFAAEIARGERPPTLLLVEHPHTYTFGRRGDAANMLWDEDTLRERDIAVHWVDRGGDITYHGPGQLVGYPLIPLTGLRSLQTSEMQNLEILQSFDYVGYLRSLEKMLIAALATFGLVAGQLNGKTGVWVQADVYSRCARCRPEDRQKPAKLAAIGVKVDAAGITRHGFALNVNPDLSYFDGIVPCGIPDYPVVALADLLTPTPAMDAVKREVLRAFAGTFGYELDIQMI
jgi:lipoate-protein ligase B